MSKAKQEQPKQPCDMHGVRQSFVKVCGDPGCEAVFHNVPKSATKCSDCGGRIMTINESTFWRKFSNNYFQYDYLTGNYYRPIKKTEQLSFDFA